MIQIRNVQKTFGTPPTEVLKGISLDIEDGQFVALTGRSGSGKSTLLYIVSSLDFPTHGSVTIEGVDTQKASQPILHNLRNEKIGFVFQFHYLLSELTAIENVLMPARKIGVHEQKRRQAASLLKDFGLGEKLDRFPRQLSGGEQQRVAIARALIMEPKYLFADEPTGNLDSINGEIVMKILRQINKDRGMTVVMVTHDPDFAALAGRQIQLADGKVLKD